MAEAENSGPYVQAAVFCQAVTPGPSGTISLVNIIEGITILATERETASTSLNILTVAIMLWAGAARGPHELALQHWRPNGQQGERLTLASLDFEPPSDEADNDAYGINTIQSMPDYKVTEVGNHWFDVLTQAPDQTACLLTRIPLTVHRAIEERS